MTTAIQSTVNRNIADLHPIMRAPLKGLIASANEHTFEIDGTVCRFEFFEGYRSPERQNYLFAIGKTTKARPWQSAHQYGLAADFAVRIMEGHRAGEWAWPHDAPWGSLKALAAIHGLDIPIKWDKGHIQHPAFAKR